MPNRVHARGVPAVNGHSLLKHAVPNRTLCPIGADLTTNPSVDISYRFWLARDQDWPKSGETRRHGPPPVGNDLNRAQPDVDTKRGTPTIGKALRTGELARS